MTVVLVIALHVFKESVRDRVLYAIAAVAAALVGASVFVGQMTAGQDVRIIKDLSLAVIEASGVLMAVFVGVTLVSREIERRSIFNVLSKPIHRRHFIIGKWLGLSATLLVNVIGMSLVSALVLAWMQATTPDNVVRAWTVPALDAALLKAVVLIVAELWLLTAIAVLVSTFSSSGVMSAVLTLGVWIVGMLSADVRTMASVTTSPMWSTVLHVVGLVVPAFSEFDVKAAVVNGRDVPWAGVGMTVVYAGVYAAGVISAAIAVFSRREFT